MYADESDRRHAPTLGERYRPVMTKVLVTGMSGTGKSSALAQLALRGYRVMDTDDPGSTEWVETSDEIGGGERLWVERAPSLQ